MVAVSGTTCVNRKFAGVDDVNPNARTPTKEVRPAKAKTQPPWLRRELQPRGYTTGRRDLVDLLRQRSRPYLFSNSLPPPVVACASKVLDILLASPKLAQQVASLTKHFRLRMTSAGFTISVSIFFGF
ncbi:hypothetical protein HPB51_012676 [Rhipicephalus microplus]|uniref:Aminotransferase class I/classII large domain-containing protein n=1 Tax=Rhipicephalus microplus TaxID=6941 RepID=A0A9J6D567_RHIMP|nr:hypothetical protein HPB51_012676 [Rhipicephalus microplus]